MSSREEPEEEEQEEPVFPPIVLPPAVGDTWRDNPPTNNPTIVANPTTQVGPVWWYHADHLGSTTYITDLHGKPVQYIEYLPFGEIMVEQSTNNILENVYKFNAKELDPQTGYYYYGARYYDPGASIFLSVDPLAEQFPGWNPYHYVHNNPINLVDPTGMSAQNPGEGDPDKKPQKLLHVVVYGADKSIYYTGKPWIIGTGGFNFYTETATRGDLSLLDGNSGEGESINADTAFSLASYATAYAGGSMYKTMKEGAEFIKNFLELMIKGKDIKDGVEKAMTDDKPKEATLPSVQNKAPSETMDFKIKGYKNKDMFNGSNEAVVRWTKDTVIDVKDFKLMEENNKADSLYNANKKF